MRNILKFIEDNYIMIIFLICGAGVFASLYFSNVLELTPCILCWYQRILFYPVFFLSAASIAFKEKLSPKFILALTIPGLIVAMYHYSIQKLGVPEGSFVTCVAGVPCDQVDWEILGFITIPLLSLIGFLLMSLVAFLKMKSYSKNT